jgi:hypothetical protein
VFDRWHGVHAGAGCDGNSSRHSWSAHR